MSARYGPRTRANVWHSSATPISTAVSSIQTDDPLTHVVTAPMPVLHLIFGGEAHGDIKLVRAEDAPNLSAGAAHETSESDRDAKEPAHPNRIELSIDSLPNYILIEPIPIAIDPVSDTAFTAWVPDLDTNATGSSVIEALLMLKERIELVYEELSKCTLLDDEQKMTLRMLHTYIAPKPPDWV